jgi:toluene monooxygenase electron transfer component
MNSTAKKATTTFSNKPLSEPMKITVQSKSGETAFDCGDRETILHAGLRQSLTLPYECATGTCGTCRARVMSGEVEMRWNEAPGAAKLKRDKGDILMCQTYARSDCVLRVPSDIAVVEELPPAPRHGIIRNIRKMTKDVAKFDLHLSAPMSFEAGQFVVVETADLVGGRAYSMVNFNAESDRIELVIKRKPGGGFSDWLFDDGRGDREVAVFGPLGRAVFHPREGRNFVCIAGGSGIAGMMSILERAVQADYFRDHRAAVFFGVRTMQDTFYLEPLSRYVAESHGNLEVTIALSDEPAMIPSLAGFPALVLASGMVHDVAAKAMIGSDTDVIAYVAGPPIMVDAAIRALIVSGVPTRDIRYDKFG